MFERYTQDSKRVIVLASEAARSDNHNYIGTEHILLGLLLQDSAARQALEAAGLTFDQVNDKILGIIGWGQQSPSGTIPCTPRAKKVQELALRESLLLGHDKIEPEHLLLALLREGNGVAAQVLVKLGVDFNRLRSNTLQLMGASTDGTQGRTQEDSSPKGNVLHVQLVGSGGLRFALDDDSVDKLADEELALVVGALSAYVDLSKRDLAAMRRDLKRLKKRLKARSTAAEAQ